MTSFGKKRFFEKEDYELFLRKEKIKSALRNAVANGFEGFDVYYQPIMDCDSGHMIGAEALMRFSMYQDKKKEPVSFVFRENSPFKIRVGKQIRAIELVLTLKESTFLPDTSYRAVIDKKQKVYIPEGVIPPEEDGSNRTPAGLKVDKNGKFSIDEQRGMDK